MANFKTNKGQDYPACDYNTLNENDPMVVKVPMDDLGWGSRKGQMGKARNPESGGNRRMGIKHVEGK